MQKSCRDISRLFKDYLVNMASVRSNINSSETSAIISKHPALILTLLFETLYLGVCMNVHGVIVWVIHWVW